MENETKEERWARIKLRREARKKNPKIVATLTMPEEKEDPTITEAVKDFPEYVKENGNWIGSKQYWTSIFKDEKNRDPELHEKFSKLHHDIVNMVIKFCEENGLEDVDQVRIYADGLKDSYGYHNWECGTDSSMSMKNIHREDFNGDEMWVRDDDNFLYEI